MESLLSSFIKTALRNLLAPVIIWVAAKGYLSEDQATAFAIALGAMISAFVWGFGNKLWNQYVVVPTALEAPAGTTKEELKAIIAGDDEVIQ